MVLAATSVTSVFIFYYFLQTSVDDTADASNDIFTNDLEEAVKPFSEIFPLDPVIGSETRWGTFNSGHYFGLKQTTPTSLETSLIWFQNELNRDGRLSMRHLCDQNDNLDFYAWTKHDFHSFGEQEIEDQGYRFKTKFLVDGDHLWSAKVEVEPMGENMKPLSLIQYITTNNPEDSILLKSHSNLDDKTSKMRDGFMVSGNSQDAGEFNFKIMIESKRENLKYDSYYSGFIDKARFPVSAYLHSKMVAPLVSGERLFVLPGRLKVREEDSEVSRPTNIIAYQMVLNGPVVIMIKFASNKAKMTDDFETIFNQKSENYQEKFQNLFHPNRIPLTGNMTKQSLDRLANVALSNMIGSIGYHYGHSYISTSAQPDRIAKYGPIQLLTGVPSRSFFPRGFLWDEGFHNLLINKWDPEVTKAIIKSWFNIMNTNGWIPREVILGYESMRRVPQEFIIQKIDNANPPVMFIVIEKLLDGGLLSNEELRGLYPRLKAWYNWFNVTQYGPEPDTFRWRGRDELSVNMLNPKTLASGLDDYPRASHPSPSEYHIDLRCWMALASRTLAEFAHRLDDKEFKSIINDQAIRLANKDLLNKLHWSETHKMYCDFGHNTEKAELVKVTKTRRSSHDPNVMEAYQVLERHSTGHPDFGCVPEFGYVSLFPLMMHLVDHTSEHFGIILDKLRDPNELWTDFGIRSLSKSSKYYMKYNSEHDKPYWRGAIWMNINYMISSSLKHYSTLEGPYQKKCYQIFNELKQNLIQNVVHQFTKTNYMWENYNDMTGEGQGSHPFTGWTSLILLIMSM